MIRKFAIGVFIAMLCAGLNVGTVQAATIDIGPIKLRSPITTKKKSRTYQRQRTRQPAQTRSSDPRWFSAVEEDIRFATNDRGIMIGYSPKGELLVQLIPAIAVKSEAGELFPVEIEVNGRYFDTLQGQTADNGYVYLGGSDVERLVDRLMSGRSVGIYFAGNAMETHLRGSSAAIRAVRRSAQEQRRRYALGQVEETQQAEETASDEGSMRYYLPGVRGWGQAEVQYSIVQDKGLVLRMRFHQIPGHGDPEHLIQMNTDETNRAIELIRKSEDWAEIARKNRVGLFSKRIGFVDDTHGAAVETPEAEKADPQTAEQVQESEPAPATQNAGPQDEAQAAEGSTKPAAGGSETAQEADQAATSKTAEVAKPEAGTGAIGGEGDPLDFIAVNFNSYEDGATSTQIEHSVKGYSRRFNLVLKDALMLADTLENTLESSSFRLEKRKFDQEETDKLFQ